MPSPTTSSSTSVVPLSHDSLIDPLLAQVKWGGAVGSGTSLTYSFPWTTNSSALFAGYNGEAYSSLSENTAAYHYGLNATQSAAARGALQAWANVANIGLTEVADTSTNVGDIRFAWTSATEASSAGNQAWGWASYPNSYWPSAGDIWISTQSSGATDTAWAVGSYNYGALLHEIGHAIGLKHTFEGGATLPAALETRQYSVMSYTDGAHSLFVKLTHNTNGSVSWQSYDVQPETPMVLDIAAAQYLYGANLGYRSGDDVYTFDPATPFMKAIWDGGGNDTISVANFSRGCTIDLRPGHYSSIAIPSDSTAGYNWVTPPPTPTYDGTDNLGIAYGATIENAVGGAGNDVLWGNDVANRLDGGAGNDTLYGGAGNDLFDWDPAQRAGTDVFYGGTGDDTFVLTAGDQAIEYANEGTDTVYVSFSYSLADNIENVVETGTAGLVLTGNALDNVIKGGAGNDTINGGAGSDSVVYDGLSSAYVITLNGISCTISSSTSGTDALSGVEFAQFADKRVTLIDTTAPTAVTFSPADQATSVAPGSNVVLTFNETIQRGSGSIVLKTAAGVVVATYDAATSTNVSISGSTLTIDPAADLAYGTAYVVQLAAGSVKDVAGNAYAGTTSYNFTTMAPPDVAAPTVLSASPLDEATGVAPGANVVLTFSEAIQRGAGSIVLKTGAGTVVATYDAATSTNLSISGSTLTIDPAADLAYGTGYVVQFAAGSVKDLAGNAYAGTTSYNFTTLADAAPPTVLNASPVDQATGVATGANLVLTFSEAIQRGTGTIVLKTAAGTVVATYDAATSTNLSIVGSTLTIDPAADLANGTGYVLELAPGTVKDLVGNGLVAAGSYHFTTIAAPVVLTGTDGADTLTGNANADTLWGGAGNDTLNGLGGNDFLDGGADLDTAVYAGPRASSTIARTTGGFTVSGPEGTDTLVNIERLHFSDANVAFDIAGAGGEAYRIYQAAFNRTPDSGGLGYWIKVLDGGASLRDAAQGFVTSAEFGQVYGTNPTNEQLVGKFYENVLHRAPDPGGYTYWVGVLNQQQDTPAGVLANISESNENQLGVIGTIGNGFDYTPYA